MGGGPFIVDDDGGVANDSNALILDCSSVDGMTALRQRFLPFRSPIRFLFCLTASMSELYAVAGTSYCV
jgi:hypothetical protein